MKHNITINVISPEEGIKIEGTYEPTAFISMCISQSLQIIEEDLKQAKTYVKQQGNKYKNPLLKGRMNDLAKAIQELRKMEKIYDTSMWYINERLDKGELLEDIMKELSAPPDSPEDVKNMMKIVPKEDDKQ